MKWNIEWIDLQNIEHMIAECWRMNERQLERYCKKLSLQKDLVFAGDLGTKFLELMCKCIDYGETPDWPKLQKDVRLMKELIQDGQDQHEVYWKSQYQELTADTAAYFGTEFGRAFTEQLAAKLELDMSEEQKMLQHDIRKIQKICASCRWEDEEKVKKAMSLLIQDEKYYFSSWLGDAFINVLQERYGKKEEDGEESGLGFEPEPELEPEPKVVRRSSLKAKIIWTLVVCISAGAAILWLYMQSNGQSRLKLQNLMSGLISAAEEKADGADGDKGIAADVELAVQSENLTAGSENIAGNQSLADLDRNTETGADYSSVQQAGQAQGGSNETDRYSGGHEQTEQDQSSGRTGQAQDGSSEAAGQDQDGGSEAAGQAQDGSSEAAGQVPGSSDGITGQSEDGSDGIAAQIPGSSNKTAGQDQGGSDSMAEKSQGGAAEADGLGKGGNGAAAAGLGQVQKQNGSGRLDRNTADTGVADRWDAAKAPDVLPQYRSFYQNYPDLFGWLKIPGTEIDHPVMQSDDTERGERYYYLHRDYAGRSSEAGSLFVESKSSCFPQDDNTVIYGHNMSNGRNFGILEKYKDKDFFKDHQVIQYDTVYEAGTYRIAAVLITRILYQEEEGFRYYRFYNYSTKSQFQECTDFIKENQLYDTDEELQYGDQLLMLSTCEYSRPNGRLVVIARKVDS